MALELKNTEHSYYCSDNNYYVGGAENHGRCDYDTWEDFKEDWLVGGVMATADGIRAGKR